jgi:hypothetical protein
MLILDQIDIVLKWHIAKYVIKSVFLRTKTQQAVEYREKNIFIVGKIVILVSQFIYQ